MKNIIIRQDGFTLIETMIAMVVFTIGILGLFGMQSAAIKENIAANSITTGSLWASSRVEELIALNYDDAEVSAVDKPYKPCDDFSSADWWQDSPLDVFPDEYPGETSNQANYFVYWAVSRDCTLVEEDGIGLEDSSEYRPKHLYIVVTRHNGNGPNGEDPENQEVIAEFSYIKQNQNN